MADCIVFSHFPRYQPPRLKASVACQGEFVAQSTLKYGAVQKAPDEAIHNGRLIAYSLGNFATYGRFNLRGASGLGVVLDLVLAKDGHFVSGKLKPTRQEGAGIPVVDPTGEAIDMVRMLSAADFPSTGVKVAQDGSLAAP